MQRPGLGSPIRVAAGLLEVRLGLGERGRGDAVGDRGGLEPVRHIEFLQDVRDVDAGCLGADDERGGDLAVRVAAGDEPENLGLAWCQAESLLESPWCVWRFGLRWRQVEPRALGEQVEVAQQRMRSDRAATAYACRSGTPASARVAPMATSASARASGSTPRGVGVRVDPRRWRPRTTSRAVLRRAHARAQPRPGPASRRRWA